MLRQEKWRVMVNEQFNAGSWLLVMVNNNAEPHLVPANSACAQNWIQNRISAPQRSVNLKLPYLSWQGLQSLQSFWILPDIRDNSVITVNKSCARITVWYWTLAASEVFHNRTPMQSVDRFLIPPNKDRYGITKWVLTDATEFWQILPQHTNQESTHQPLRVGCQFFWDALKWWSHTSTAETASGPLRDW